jgi:hypothetical protein
MLRLSFDFNRNFASTAFERARAMGRGLAALALLVALFRLFDAATFLFTALAGLFAALCPRAAVPDRPRVRFVVFAISFFILSRIALRVARAFDADFLLRTRFRALDSDGSLGARLDADFALDPGLAFFVFDFVDFFVLLRAGIVELSTQKYWSTRYISCTNSAPQSIGSELFVNENRRRRKPRSRIGVRSTN